MNRVSRRSADEAAEALLDAGRSQPSLDYDIELGLARHHHWLRNEAPMPEWASAGLANATATTASRSFVAALVKTIVSSLLVGALATAAWQAWGRMQPSAAKLERPSAGAESTPPAQPGRAASEVAESVVAPKPIPVPEHVTPSDQPLRRAVRADVHDKRAARGQRAHKENAATRNASAPASTGAEPTAARMEPAASGASPSPLPLGAALQTRSEGVAASEPKSTSTARRPALEPRTSEPAPTDLVEMQQVATAEQLLERSPARALALVREGDQRFARGYFQQERAYIAIMALIRLGRIEEARTRAASFAKHYPALPYGARIRSALEGRQAQPSAAAREPLP